MPPTTLSEWVCSVATPFTGQPCGEDPRYLNDFQDVKEEIDKLRNVDYATVLTTCRNLLGQVTKDLRIAGYYLMGATYVDGLPGLLEALQAYRMLLENFWEACHPQSETARLGALGMLNNAKIVSFAEQHIDQTNENLLDNLQQEINLINAFLTGKLGEEAPRLTALATWTEKLIKRRVATETPTPTESEVTSSSTGKKVVEDITSEHDLGAITRKIHTHLIRSGELGRALAYSRAFRWGSLILPPHEKGRTRIPEPRISGWTELQHIVATESPDSVLSSCEKLFFEPGFHLLFDLQFQEYQQAEAMNRPHLALFIRNALSDLLQRQPQLIDLSFADGTAFAGIECKQWILECQATASKESLPEQDSVDNRTPEESRELVKNAMRLAIRKQLPQALQQIQSLPVATEKQRVRKTLHEAHLCLAAGKAFIADALLEELQERVLAQHLITWDPGLAVEIFQQRATSLQSLEKIAEKEEKNRIAHSLNLIRKMICTIDIAAAARFV
ncbi:MAG: type VI secretion system protein TssA [Desulforhopalus sp.]